MTAFIEQSDDDVLLAVKAVPGASRDQIAGVLGERLKIRIAAPPEGGKANKAISQLLAKTLGVPRNRVTIDSGRTGPEKTVRITNTTVAHVRRALNAEP
jgi:uncharacterized protein (TIGR00251 family)